MPQLENFFKFSGLNRMFQESIKGAGSGAAEAVSDALAGTSIDEFLGHFDVIRNARRQPHIVDRKLITRIMDRETRHDLRPKVSCCLEVCFCRV